MTDETLSKQTRTASDLVLTLQWLSKLGLLSVELIGFRFRRARIASILAVGEPIAVVAFFSLVHSVIGVERPPFGTSTPLFYTTGVIPFYLFFHSSLRFRLWDYLPRFPQVNEFELAVSQLTSELISKIIILIFCCIPIYIMGSSDAVPSRTFVCLGALISLSLLGSGLGLLNAVIAGFFFPWTYIYQVLIRGWMAFSGILVVADYIPEPLRTAATWVPITHAITLFRLGQYGRYPDYTLNLQYLIWTTALCLIFGCVVESGTRRWRTFR